MNNLNSLTPASINKINALVEKINATCDALMSALDFNTESVSSYNMTILDRMNMNSEFIDLVTKNIISMKNHLADLKLGLCDVVISDTGDLKNIVSGLKETSDKLNLLLISDNNFNNVYSMAVMEIQEMIGQVMDEIRVGEVVLR